MPSIAEKQQDAEPGEQDVTKPTASKGKGQQSTDKESKLSSRQEPRRSKRQASQKSNTEKDAVPANDEVHQSEKANSGRKRKNASSEASSNKKPKSEKKKVNENSKNTDGTFGSKHMSADEPAPRGANDRLPKKGQKAFWKAMPGIVDGTVEEVLREGKMVAGKQVKASEDDPKIVLKSAKSEKICVHKPDACFYD